MGRNSKKTGPKGNYKFLVVVGVALVSAFLVNQFLYANTRVVGNSMLPYLQDNDWIVTNRLSYLRSEPAVGDVVVVLKKDVIDQPIVKRIEGTPSDTIEIRAGRLYRNDKPVNDRFSPMDQSENMRKITVPKNCYFLVGDNRKLSNDSRRWKNPFVKKSEIIGKAVLKYFPGVKILR